MCFDKRWSTRVSYSVFVFVFTFFFFTARRSWCVRCFRRSSSANPQPLNILSFLSWKLDVARESKDGICWKCDISLCVCELQTIVWCAFDLLPFAIDNCISVAVCINVAYLTLVICWNCPNRTMWNIRGIVLLQQSNISKKNQIKESLIEIY